MKNLFTLILIFFCAIAFAQNSNKDLNELHQQIEKNRLKLDSTMSSLDSTMQRATQFNDSMATTRRLEMNTQNFSGLVSMMQERERKEKQKMWLRIGLGIAMLVLGIVAITRKKKTSTT